MAERALELTIDYAKTHEQLGRPIAALVHGATRQGWSKGSDDAVTS